MATITNNLEEPISCEQYSSDGTELAITSIAIGSTITLNESTKYFEILRYYGLNSIATIIVIDGTTYQGNTDYAQAEEINVADNYNIDEATFGNFILVGHSYFAINTDTMADNSIDFLGRVETN